MMEGSKVMGEIEGNGGINGKVEDIRGGTPEGKHPNRWGN